MRIRKVTISDVPELKLLYENTILSINSRDYNREQISAWVSTSENTDSLQKKILEDYFIVAIANDGTITGFASLNEKSGYLDVLYVHKDYQEMGIATMLVHDLLKIANDLQIKEITTDASITARPFFEKRGFRLTTVQKVVVRRVEMTNFKMSFTLDPHKV